MTAPRVSICLPTLDAERDLTRLLPRLATQRVEGGHELVAIDSASADDTCQLLRRAGARVERIARAEFRHGATRNRLASLARGERLVFLSQDALPEGDEFVARLVAPLEEEGVVGATARVLPHPDDDPLTARTALSAPEASDVSRPIAAGEAGAPRFNNVASAMRASALAETPFPDVSFGEDLAWAEAVLARGGRLVFAADAVVYHAHAYTVGEAFERYRVDAAFQLRERGVRVRPGWLDVVRGFAHELREDLRYVRRHGGWSHLLRSPGLRGAQVLGQWIGSRGRREGGSNHP